MTVNIIGKVHGHRRKQELNTAERDDRGVATAENKYYRKADLNLMPEVSNNSLLLFGRL